MWVRVWVWVCVGDGALTCGRMCDRCARVRLGVGASLYVLRLASHLLDCPHDAPWWAFDSVWPASVAGVWFGAWLCGCLRLWSFYVS